MGSETSHEVQKVKLFSWHIFIEMEEVTIPMKLTSQKMGEIDYQHPLLVRWTSHGSWFLDCQPNKF